MYPKKKVESVKVKILLNILQNFNTNFDANCKSQTIFIN